MKGVAERTEEDSDVGEFSPFGREDLRALQIDEEAARLLAREPAPLRILVPAAEEPAPQPDPAVGTE